MSYGERHFKYGNPLGFPENNISIFSSCGFDIILFGFIFRHILSLETVQVFYCFCVVFVDAVF